jgi:1,2-diacylglycerol 3-beta-glucosyltransferase
LTPPSWRIASLVVLLGGFAAGWLVAVSPAGLPIAAVVAVAALVFAGRLAIAGRRAPVVSVRAPAALPTLSVLIAARDEATVIGRLIGDLAAQDHLTSDGQRAFEVIVIDDRSTDGTGPIAAAAAEAAGMSPQTRVLRREGVDLPDGKGAALTMAQPDVCRGDGVVVLDGDARIGPAFLRTLAGYLAQGIVAVTPRRQTSLEHPSWLARAQAAEQAQDGALQRGRWATGGCSEFRGDGLTIGRDALAAAGGWRANDLTEDLSLSTRLAARLGVTVAWAIDAVVSEEPVRTWRALWRQRVRWAEGSLRRVFEFGGELLASRTLPARAKIDFVSYVGQLAAAPLIVGAIAGAVRSGIAAATLTLMVGYLASSGLLAYVGLGREARADSRPLSLARRLGGTALASLFSFLWLATIPGGFVRLATRRGRLTYAKMAHEPVVERG